MSRSHVLTVAVEDYFHVAAFKGAVRESHWERFESRLSPNIDRTLELLARFGVHATFFVLGWVAERQPEIVRRIAEAGHEIASRGYWPRSIDGLGPDQIREDLRRTKAALEAAGSNPILGHRFGSWLGERDLWLLELLAEEGYLYDSSINPRLRRSAVQRISFEARPYRIPGRDLSIWEFPLSTMNLAGVRLPISGGNYTRQLPHLAMRQLVSFWDLTREGPLVYYFMPWELDREQPKVTAISRLNRIRQYRNLEKARWMLEDYLTRYSFVPIGQYLGIPYQQQRLDAPPPEPGIPEVRGEAPPRPGRKLQDVTLVVPLFNEESNVPYMVRTLGQVRQEMSRAFRLRLMLVDDGSSDGTFAALEQRTRDMPDCHILRHPRNKGVAAAIVTGLRQAATDVVCTIDCDLSYDPSILARMIPMLEGADLVTASPYHPRGKVRNVPGWRLLLSRNLSRLYSLCLGERLYTYTSCCRVYRREAVRDVQLEFNDFLGVAELLLCIKLRGGKVVEFPATLESRLFGVSKMKTLHTIGGHLRILSRLTRRRCPGGRPLGLQCAQAPGVRAAEEHE